MTATGAARAATAATAATPPGAAPATTLTTPTARDLPTTFDVHDGQIDELSMVPAPTAQDPNAVRVERKHREGQWYLRLPDGTLIPISEADAAAILSGGEEAMAALSRVTGKSRKELEDQGITVDTKIEAVIDGKPVPVKLAPKQVAAAYASNTKEAAAAQLQAATAAPIGAAAPAKPGAPGTPPPSPGGAVADVPPSSLSDALSAAARQRQLAATA